MKPWMWVALAGVGALSTLFGIVGVFVTAVILTVMGATLATRAEERAQTS